MRIRPSSTHETAKVSASNRNGAQRVTAYSTPPSGPPTRPATCWRACCWLSAVGSCSVGTTVRTADISAGAKTPAATPVSSATDEEVRHGQHAQQPGDDQGAVEEHPGAGGDAHHPAAVPPVGEQPAGQQGQPPCPSRSSAPATAASMPSR